MSARVVAAAILGSILAGLPVLAGVGAGNGEVGFDLGYTDFDSDITSESGTDLNVRGGYHFTRLFQLEGQLATAVAEESGVDITLSTFLVNAVINFRAGENVVPYVLVGIGQSDLELEAGPFTVDDEGRAYQVAGGGRFFVGKNKRMAVRVEIASLEEKTFDESSRHTNFNAGLTWRIGRERP